MKTVFFQIAAGKIASIPTLNYFASKDMANGLNELIDKHKNANGKKPEIRVNDHSFTNPDGRLQVSFYFDNDNSDEALELYLPVVDFQRWVCYNGCAIWFEQNVGQLDWYMTLKEELTASHVLLYLQDICYGRVCYKQEEFIIKNSI